MIGTAIAVILYALGVYDNYKMLPVLEEGYGVELTLGNKILLTIGWPIAILLGTIDD